MALDNKQRHTGMKISMFVILGLALTLTTFSSREAHAQDEQGYRVIVHPDNPAESITKSTLSKYLLRKGKRWEHGLSVEPVDLDSQSEVRRAFSREVHGRSVSSIVSYWTRMIFSGRDVPPPEVANDAAVIAHVRSNPGAIGYVSASASLDGVKEITVIE